MYNVNIALRRLANTFINKKSATSLRVSANVDTSVKFKDNVETIQIMSAFPTKTMGLLQSKIKFKLAESLVSVVYKVVLQLYRSVQLHFRCTLFKLEHMS